MKIRSDMPIILCTGFSESINREQAIDMGFTELIYKPVLTKDLIAAIRKAIDGNKVEEQTHEKNTGN